MALHDPQMRVATSGTDAKGKNYSRSTPATTGFVLTAQGEDLPPIWAPGTGGAPLFVTDVYFVDARNVGAADGSLTNPFPTVQGAIDKVHTDNVNRAIIMIAPENYVENLVVPAGGNLGVLIFQSWYQPNVLSAPGAPNISGNLTITETGPGAAKAIELNGTFLSGNVASDNPATHDLSLRLQASTVGGTIAANNITLYLHQSTIGGPTVIGATSLDLRTDGFSWSNLVLANVALLPAAYTREFYDTGADETYDQTLSVQRLQVGAMAVVECTYVSARPGEYAIASLMADPAPTDFAFGFHHTEADKVFFWLHNISRANTNFNEPVDIVVFHGGMALIPQAPP